VAFLIVSVYLKLILELIEGAELRVKLELLWGHTDVERLKPALLCTVFVVEHSFVGFAALLVFYDIL